MKRKEPSTYTSEKKAVEPEKILANDLIVTATTMAATILCQRDDSFVRDITKVFKCYSIHILETGQMITTEALHHGCRAIYPERICAISDDPKEEDAAFKQEAINADWYCEDWDHHIRSCKKLAKHPGILFWLDACSTLDKLWESIHTTITSNLAPVAVIGITFCEHYQLNATREERVASLDEYVISEGKKVGKTISRECILIYGHHAMVLVIYIAYDREFVTTKVGEKRALDNVVKLQELCDTKMRLLEMLTKVNESRLSERVVASEQRPTKRCKYGTLALALHVVGTLDTVHLNVQTDQDINYVKEYLRRMYGREVVDIRYQGKVLEDEWSLDKCGIEDDDIVEVYV